MTTTLALVIAVPTLSTYIGPALSILTGLLVRVTLPSWGKALVNLLLAAVTTEVARAVQLDRVLVLDVQWLTTFAWTFLLSAAAYWNLWKPTGVVKVVQERVPGIIGRREPQGELGERKAA